MNEKSDLLILLFFIIHYWFFRVLRNYMIWQIIINLAPDLGFITQPAIYRFKSVVDGTISGTTSVWEKCIGEISDSLLGDPLGLIFIDEKFRKESLDEVINECLKINKSCIF